MRRKRVNMKEGQPGRRGGVPGREGRSSRSRATGPEMVERPDRRRCGSRRLVMVKKSARLVTDIEHVIKAVARMHVIVTCRCRRCGRKVYAEEPAPRGTSLGPNILATIMDLWYRRISMDMTREFLAMFGLRVAKATIHVAWRALARSMGAEARTIHGRVARAGVASVDETAYPVGRRRAQAWVQVGGGGVDIRVAPSRFRAAFDAICQDQGGAFVTDTYVVYMAPGVLQVCWAHILRKADCVEGTAVTRPVSRGRPDPRHTRHAEMPVS